MFAILLNLAVCLVGPEIPRAVLLWEQGQDAMLQDQPDRAIACYVQSLQHDPGLARNFLSLAAAFQHKGEDDKAVTWLARYLHAQPDHVAVRLHYVELLWKLRRAEGATEQLARYIADVQRSEARPAELLLAAHTQALGMALARKDTQAARLHRGIGLYWLASLKSDDDDPSPEGLLCQAAAELLQAQRARPESARACWYLHRVWARVGQQTTARKWLHKAEEACQVPGHDLTGAEAEELSAAAVRSRQRTTPNERF